MARAFDVQGWQDWNDVTYTGDPTAEDSGIDLVDVQGMFVYVYNTTDPDDYKYIWVRVPGPMPDWDLDRWMAYIDTMIDQSAPYIGGGGAPVVPA